MKEIKFDVGNGKTYIIYDIREDLPRHKTKIWDRRKLSDINSIVGHQSAGHARTASAPGIDCKNTEAINNYHINPNHISKTGCPRICYHFSIERDGKIEMCNDLEDIVWHAGNKKINAESISYVVCGNFSGKGWTGSQEPTPEQIESTWVLMYYLAKGYKIQPSRVFGHCDVKTSKPACPGTVIYNTIKMFRGETL
jgi:hypothetical protein